PPPLTMPPGSFPMATQHPISHNTNVGGSLDSIIDAAAAPESKRQAQEQERRDKEQQEKLDRMAQQAKELEDRLERLSSSMGPAGAAADPETTRVQQPSPGAAPNAAARPSVIQGQPIKVDLDGKRKGPPIFLIAAIAGVFIIAVIGIGGYVAYK